jgi:hypothetical protein
MEIRQSVYLYATVLFGISAKTSVQVDETMKGWIKLCPLVSVRHHQHEKNPFISRD